MIFLFPRWDMLIPWRVHTKKKKGMIENSIRSISGVGITNLATGEFCDQWTLVRGFTPQL